MRNIRGLKEFKSLYLFLGLALTFILSVGYAILNTTLSINGIAEISKNTWDVHFENVVVQDGNVTATTPATISDTKTEVTFTVPLEKPGDTYSFLVDIVNSGTIDAKLNEILKTGITTENESYLIFDISYSSGVLINENDQLKASSKDTILVTVGYKMDITNEELVSTDKSVSLSLSMNYVQDDGSALAVDSTIFRVARVRSVLDNTQSEYVTSTTGIDFSDISSDTNGKGIYTLAATSEDSYPIYYYRGAVEDNNVLFAGFCWKIVRTTETGGTKLVYNGTPDSDGACTATGSDTAIGSSSFYSSDTYADVGYMYGEGYESNWHLMSVRGFKSQSGINYWGSGSSNFIYSDTVTYDSSTGLYTLVDGENRVWQDTYMNQNNLHKYTCRSETSNTCSKVYYVVGANYADVATMIWFTGGNNAEATSQMEVVYGNDVTYDTETGMYTLTNTTTLKVIDWIYNYEKIVGENGYHYTCFSDSDTCSEVSYIYFYTEEELWTDIYNASWYIKLSNGETISSALDSMFTNTNDSTVKSDIDTWYANNMTDYTDMLEDTVWCNDRSISNYGGWNKDSSAHETYLDFSGYKRSFLTYEPTFSCQNKNDSFTVSDTTKGNGALTYPVGLLTADETMYAEVSKGKNNEDFYLYNEKQNLLLTPEGYGAYDSYNILLNSNGDFASYGNEKLVRPSISLKKGITYTGGKGTKDSPFVIEKQ